MILESNPERSTIKKSPTISEWRVTCGYLGRLIISWVTATTNVARSVAKVMIMMMVCHLSALPLVLVISNTPILGEDTPYQPSWYSFLDCRQESRTFVLLYNENA
jgi:hypothetical protein